MRGKLTFVMATATAVGAIGIYYGVTRASPAGAARTHASTAQHKDCSEATPLFSVGGSWRGAGLTAIQRVCEDPVPLATAAAGGRIDPDSLHRANYTSFLYGDCTPQGDSGCPYPLEIQVWPACERNPASFSSNDSGSDLDEDERAGPSLLGRTEIRGVPTYSYGQDGGTPDRAEALVGDTTVVVFLGDDAPTTLAAQTEELTAVVSALRPAGDSNHPIAQAESANLTQALPAPVAGVESGSLRCDE